MFRTSWLHSAYFRTACIYAALFAFSVLTIFGASYILVQAEMELNLTTSIDKDVATLVADYNLGGLSSLKEGVDERLSETQGLDRVYVLIDANGTVLSGNTSTVPREKGWYYGPMSVPPGASGASPGLDHVFGKMIRLANSALFVGRDATAMAETLETLFWTFIIGGVVTSVAALFLGLLLGRHATKRIRALGLVTQSIVANGMKGRIPLQGAGDEIDMVSTEFNLVFDRIQSLMENIKQITDDIAHDLRTPLSRLRQKLDFALHAKTSDAKSYRNTIEQAVAETDGIMDTFSALLRIAQIEGGARRGSFTTVNLSEIVASLKEVYEPVIEDAKLNFHTDIQYGVYVTGDRELLVQLFANLIENAIRHGRGGLDIYLTLAENAGEAKVIVADHGTGIPQSERQKVFRRLYRGDKSRSTKGHGLGMSLVAAIVELHGAKISLEDNQPGLRALVALKSKYLNEVPVR